jgi:hypothetical protein
MKFWLEEKNVDVVNREGCVECTGVTRGARTTRVWGQVGARGGCVRLEPEEDVDLAVATGADGAVYGEVHGILFYIVTLRCLVS